MDGDERAMDGSDADSSGTAREGDGELGSEGSVEAHVSALLEEIAMRFARAGRLESLEDEREWICTEMEKLGSSALSILSEALDSRGWPMTFAVVKCIGCFGEDALDVLDKALGDEEWRVRGIAVRELGRIGVSALGALSKAATDPHDDVRLNAIRQMGCMGEPALDPLSLVLSSEDASTRRAVVQELGGIGEPALESLAGALKDPHNIVVDAAIEQLRGIGEPALGTVTQVMEDGDEEARYAAVRVLGGIRLPALGVLTTALEDESSRVRRAAVAELGKIGEPALDALTYALEDEERGVREEATVQLASWDPVPVHVLVRALEDPRAETGVLVRSWLAGEGPIGRKLAVPAVARAVIDELVLRGSGRSSTYFNPEVSAKALEAIIQAQPRLRGEVLGMLCDLAYAESGGVRDRAVAVARLLGPAEFAQLVKGRSEDEPETAAAIMRLLGGTEATAFFSELQSVSLAEYRAPLVELEEVARTRWEELTAEVRRSARKSDWMSVSVFVVGTVVVITTLVVLAVSDELGKQIAAGASGLGTIIAAYVTQFWKEPVEQIQRFSAQQARLQVAFIGYMNRISELRLIFEGEYTEGKIGLNELQQYQKMLRDATEQAWSQLEAREREIGEAPGPTQLPAGEQPGTSGEEDSRMTRETSQQQSKRTGR